MEFVRKHIQQIYKALLLFVAGLLVVACGEPVEKKHQSGGWITVAGERYTLAGSRIGDVAKDDDDMHTYHLSAYTSGITMNGVTTSGRGAIMTFELFCSGDTLSDGIYNFEEMYGASDVCDSASLIVYPKSNTEDTLLYTVTGGYVQISSFDWGKQYDWHMLTQSGDSLVGHYVGAVLKNVHYDADTVGYLSVDTAKYALRRANVVSWGELFTEGSFYYEYYFYTTDMRTTDNGKLFSGLMFVLGVQSESADGPKSGTYAVSHDYENNTVLYGHKKGATFWGSYWVRYANGSSISRANVMKDSIEIDRNGNQYNITFHLKDQTGNAIDGTYNDIISPISFPEADTK